MKCPCCKIKSEPLLIKSGVQYYQCKYCETVFSGALPNDNKIGGGFEDERNEQNSERIERVKKYLPSLPNKRILDFGCGHGMLVKDMVAGGLDAHGYDKYNPSFDKIDGMFGLFTIVEVIEHLSEPFDELDMIRCISGEAAVLYVESSFTDVAKQEQIPLEDFFYISPEVGHSTIFSHKGLDILMAEKGFYALEPINRNVRIYGKL